MKSRMRSLMSHGLLEADFPAAGDVRRDIEYDHGDLVGTLNVVGGDAVDVEIVVTEGVIE